MKWTDETISNAIYDLMKKINIERMPTSTEMRENQLTGLMRAISLTGGLPHWAEKLGLSLKVKKTFWTDERIKNQLLECMDALQIDRMPVASELAGLGRNDLHCAISKSKSKYSGWAERLGLELKSSETVKGNLYEGHVAMKIREFFNELSVLKMTTKHPFDLLVNDCLKIDVKVGKAHHHFGSRAYTFGLSKKYATCDLYVCVALDEEGKIEKYFVIPSKFAQVTTLNIGTDSKYNRFINKWVYVKKFVEMYQKVIDNAI